MTMPSHFVLMGWALICAITCALCAVTLLGWGFDGFDGLSCLAFAYKDDAAPCLDLHEHAASVGHP